MATWVPLLPCQSSLAEEQGWYSTRHPHEQLWLQLEASQVHHFSHPTKHASGLFCTSGYLMLHFQPTPKPQLLGTPARQQGRLRHRFQRAENNGLSWGICRYDRSGIKDQPWRGRIRVSSWDHCPSFLQHPSSPFQRPPLLGYNRQKIKFQRKKKKQEAPFETSNSIYRDGDRNIDVDKWTTQNRV